MAIHADEVRRAAVVVDVPGTPLSLRLDRVEEVRGSIRLTWSFIDPEQPARRIRDVTTFNAVGDAPGAARSWWEQVQVAAAHRYKQEVDADTIVGEPYVRKVWTREEAWSALLQHLGAYGHDVRTSGNEITVSEPDGETTVYRIDPAQWAAYLRGPEPRERPDARDSPFALVPSATPTVGSLPLWVTDELIEAAGTSTVVGLVDGKIVGLARDE